MKITGIVINPCEIIPQFSEESNLNKTYSWIEMKSTEIICPGIQAKLLFSNLTSFFPVSFLCTDLFIYSDHFLYKEINN